MLRVSRDYVAAAIFPNPAKRREGKGRRGGELKKIRVRQQREKSRVNLQCGIKSL